MISIRPAHHAADEEYCHAYVDHIHMGPLILWLNGLTFDQVDRQIRTIGIIISILTIVYFVAHILARHVAG